MATISSLVVLLQADIKQFEAGMAKASATTKTTTGGMTGAISKFGAVAQVAVATAGIAVLKFGADAVSAASDLNESVNKTRVVFGQSSDQVIKWSKTMASSFGISQQAALESASTMGNLFDAMGLANDAGTEMSQTLVELASDLASFNNASPEDVLAAMQSGLTGQIRPLRQFGIEISEAALKQEALAQGITKSTSEMTMAEKVQLRYALILKQTGNAQGDFARTSDALANQQRILGAQWADLQATIGTLLLPTVLELVGVLNDLAESLKFVLDLLPDFGPAGDEAARGFNTAKLAADSFFNIIPGVIVKAHELGKENGKLAGLLDGTGEASSRTQDQLDALGEAALGTATDMSSFAHMTTKDFDTWRHDSIADLNGVQGSLEDLANEAHLTATEILKAFEKQLKAMADYQKNWQELINRGLPDTLAQQLQEMGLKGAGIVSALATANEQKFNKIIADWQKAQGEAADTANAISGIGNAVRGLPSSATIAVKTIFTREGHMPSFQHGGVVPQTGPALLHKGETVIPKDGGMGTTVNLTINGDVTGEEVVRKVRDGLLKLKARNSTTGL